MRPGPSRLPLRPSPRPGPRLGLLALLATGASLAGCFTEILPVETGSTLTFICAALDPEEAETFVIQSWVAPGIALDRGLAVATLRAELQDVSGRGDDHISAIDRPAPPTPRGGWNDTSVQAWGHAEGFLAPGRVILRVLWVPTLGDGNQTGSAAAPGVIALSHAAITAGAEKLRTSPAVVARVALLHFAGHAMGVVNKGVPVQDPDIQEREGPPTHDPDPASVLHAAWEDVRTMAWAANATYDRYPDAVRADWAAARQPGGVCQ